MQVFIIGSPLDTAMCLDKKRLNKQIIECGHEVFLPYNPDVPKILY